MGEVFLNVETLQIATNDTVLKMVDTYNSMYKKMYKLTLICIISVAIILSSLFVSVVYFLNTFELEMTSTETTQTIEGDGKINNIEGDGTINNIDSEGNVTIGGE